MMANATMFATLETNKLPEDYNGTVKHVNFVDDEGNPVNLGGASTLQNATTTTPGIVKQAEHVADPAGDTPTKAEYIALRDALVTAGLMASA